MSISETRPPLTTAKSIPLSRSAASSATSEVERKQRRLLLREFYGLPSGKGEDPLDIDLPNSFNADLYFSALSSSASLPELLKRENEFLMEIRELDGERQSLVYNHHHELIEASDTIRKMKSRAESLDISLENLKSSFQSISQLSATLAPPTPSLQTPLASSFPNSITNSLTKEDKKEKRLSIEVLSLSSRGRSGSVATLTGSSVLSPTTPTSKSVVFSPLIHLPPLLALPILLKSLLATEGNRARANSTNTISGDGKGRKANELWGVWEPILRAWEDAGVQGVEEVGRACREVLRER